MDSRLPLQVVDMEGNIRTLAPKHPYTVVRNLGYKNGSETLIGQEHCVSMNTDL